MTSYHLTDILAVEVAVLAELANDLIEDGLDEHAHRIREAIDIIDDAGISTIDKIKRVVPLLRPVDRALEEAKIDELSKGLRRIRRRLAYEADKLLRDTQKLSTGEYKPVK